MLNNKKTKIYNENKDLFYSDKIIKISLGSYHSSAVSSTGRVFTWGSNHSGQLGLKTIYITSANKEIKNGFGLSLNEKIVSLSLGNDQSSAVSSTGRVFTWGSNDSGQLGDNSSTDKSIPTEITSEFNLSSNDKIVSLSLGSFHSSAVSSTGRVFTWGSNDSGQLGDNSSIDKTIPTEITSKFNLSSNDKIISLSLGNVHSSAVSSTGRVFTWGSNIFDQLGIEKYTSEIYDNINELNYFFVNNDNSIHGKCIQINNAYTSNNNDELSRIVSKLNLSNPHENLLYNLYNSPEGYNLLKFKDNCLNVVSFNSDNLMEDQYFKYLYYKYAEIEDKKQEMIELLSKSAELDYPIIHIALSYHYKKVNQNEKAYYHTVKAANLEKNNSWFMNDYATFLDEGIGCKKQIDKARKLFKIAHDQGSLNAAYNLALHYKKTGYLDQAFKSFAIHYEETKDSLSLRNMSNILNYFSQRMNQNIFLDIFIRQLDVMINYDLPKVFLSFGYMYKEGIGFEQNDLCAYSLLKIALELGNEGANYHLDDYMNEGFELLFLKLKGNFNYRDMIMKRITSPYDYQSSELKFEIT
jgi:TPR repeat protein